jgi:hypothetical protein
MSFQGYLDTIKAKTGLDPDDFVRLAAERGLTGRDIKAGDVIAWLSTDYGLGRGHAMAIVAVLKGAIPAGEPGSAEDGLEVLFAGPRARWAATYEQLWAHVRRLGNDTGTQPTKKYVSFTRNGRKFAIVAPTGARLDLGLKLDPSVEDPRLELSGRWNSMVTHRVRIAEPGPVDASVLGLLTNAYERAAGDITGIALH